MFGDTGAYDLRHSTMPEVVSMEKSSNIIDTLWYAE